MTKNLKYFLIFLFLSFTGWWGINLLAESAENFFYWREFASNPKILTAQASQLAFEEGIRNLKPLLNKSAPFLEIKAKSAVSVFISGEGKERILFEKNINQRLPIASLTKLMTAYVVLENYDLSKNITISKEAIGQEESLGKLSVGQVLSVEQLLYPLLIESSNDAAFALANDYNGMNVEKFVQLMNFAADNLGLKSTYFVNVTGLDPEGREEINYSTVLDLARLSKILLAKPIIWEILFLPEYKIYGQKLINTNELVVRPGIIGGKTGYTEKALGCFLLVTEAPRGKGYLINVILGSTDRFTEMENLLNWLQEAYNW